MGEEEMRGQCPHCKQRLSTVRLENVDVVTSPLVGSGGPYVGVTYVCPHCDSILNVQIDPVALKTDTVSELMARLRKG